MGAIAGAAAFGVYLANSLSGIFDPGLALPATIFMAGGLELMLLSAIANNPRFIRAINAKYQKDIDAFQKTKTLVEYYNNLTHESQKRFDKFRNTVKDVRENYTKISTTAPNLVNNFLAKLSTMELSYVRLLYFKDKFPSLEKGDMAHTIVTEIDKLNQELRTASDRVKKAKEKRLKLLEMRMDSYQKVQENQVIIEEQLTTIEEMVAYMKDQPMSIQNTEREDVMIDNLLFETEQTQQSLEEIESLMRSEFFPSAMDDLLTPEDEKREKLED